MIILKRHHQGPEPPAHYRPTRRRRLNDASTTAVPLPQSSAATVLALGTRPISKHTQACSSTTIPSTCPNLTSFYNFPNVTFPTSFVRKRQPSSCPPRTIAGISSLPTELVLKVLFHLPLVDIIQVAQTCRKVVSI